MFWSSVQAESDAEEAKVKLRLNFYQAMVVIKFYSGDGGNGVGGS